MTDTLIKSEPRKRSPSGYRRGEARGRTSLAAGQEIYNRGGIGFIARRGVMGRLGMSLATAEGVNRLATFAPMQLLLLMADFVPEVARALDNDLRLGCDPESIRLVAKQVGPSGENAPDGTAAINEMFANLPSEVNGLIGALSQNFQMALFTGLAACEAVPGPSRSGIAEIWPVNTLSLEFRRTPDTGKLSLWQRQTIAPIMPTPAQTAAQAKRIDNFVPMPMDRFFWSALDPMPDDPYGKAAYASVLNAAMDLLSTLRDAGIAFHRVGSGRWNVGFDFAAWGAEAREIMGLTNADDIAGFLRDKFDAATAAFDTLDVDATFFHGATDKVEVAGGSEAVSATKDAVFIRLRRLIMALKQNPALMGVVEGTTETWSGDQFRIYATGLETARLVGLRPLRDAAQLHLRLLGMPYTVEIEADPIHANQRLSDAQAEKIEIENAARKRDEGFQAQDDSSMEITGAKAVAPGPIYRKGAKPAAVTEVIPG